MLALMLTGLFVSVLQAQEKTEQLWLMAEEAIKPAMIDQYMEVSKELAEICKQENFPFSYNVWVSQPFHYLITYMLKDMNDIAKIGEAWDAIIEKYGEENFKRFQDCIESQTERVMAGLPYLYYEPETATGDWETDYCYWQEITVNKGSEKAVEDIFKKGVEIMKEKGVETAMYIGSGRLGYDRPIFFAWSFSKDQRTFLEQEKKFAEMVGEDWKQINQEIVKHIRGIRNVDIWHVKDLSYQKAE